MAHDAAHHGINPYPAKGIYGRCDSKPCDVEPVLNQNRDTKDISRKDRDSCVGDMLIKWNVV